MAEVEGYFFFLRTLLRLIGLSLERDENLYYRLYTKIICGSLSVYLYLLVFDIVTNLYDVDILVDSLFHAITYITILAKFLVVYINREKMNKTLKGLENGVFAPNPKRGGSIEKIWAKKCITNLNKLTVASWALGFIPGGIIIMATMIKRISSSNSKQWRLPFGVLSMFDTTTSPNFELAWLFASTMFTVAGSIYLTTDILVVSVFSHIALQFKILHNAIKKMSTNITEDSKDALDFDLLKEVSSSALTWKTLADRLKANVEYHMAILDVAQQFEEILNVLVLYNYIAALVALACLMFHASLYPLTDPRFQKDSILTMALIFQIFLTSYFGNEVAEKSKMILLGCYEVNFVGTDIGFQKGLCIIMSRCQKPTTFTIGKFADLSLVLFMSVVRASFSYYMVLQKMNTGAKQ